MMPEASGSEELARLTGTADQVRRVFEALPVLAFGTEGPEFRYTAANAVFRASLGRAEVVGTPLADAFAELVGQQIEQLYREVYTTGKALVLHEYRAQLLTDGGPPAPLPAPGGGEPFLILDQPSAPRARIQVDGPVNAQTAPALERHLQHATGAGTRPLTLDLTGVTQLASAGVAVLHRAAGQSAAHKTELRLFAPLGSPAQMIAELVRLAYTTADPDY